jgi:hypothetical protein
MPRFEADAPKVVGDFQFDSTVDGQAIEIC